MTKGGLFERVAAREASPAAVSSERSERFHVLSVCTGNICRSPVSEAIWRGWAARVPGVSSESAGVGAVVGRPMEPAALAISQPWWSAAEQFRARQIDESMTQAADLVLVMSAGQRHEVLQMDPSALHRTFLVRDLDAVLEALVGGGDRAAESDAGAPAGESAVHRAHRLIGQAARRRDLAERPQEVTDPFRLPREQQDAILTELGTVINRIAGRLLGR